MANTTKLADLIDPQVLSDLASDSLPKALQFMNLAEVDYTLQGVPGSTITLPKWGYIGDATDVLEGEDIPVAKLTATTSSATVKKAGKGVPLTDEAVLSGYGNPIEQAAKQLVTSVAQKIDNDILTALSGTTSTLEADAIDIDAVEQGLLMFSGDDTEPIVLLANKKTVFKLRKLAGANWEARSELTDRILEKGTFGSLLGAQVVQADKIADDVVYLVKPGALQLYVKRGLDIESTRDAQAKSTILFADQHYVAHLYDDSKAVKITVKADPGP